MLDKPQILAVDDDVSILYTLTAIADLAGWQLWTAASGQEALAAYFAHNPDLVIVDCHMPRMDGVTLVTKLRAMDGNVPIVILTVDDRHELAAQFGPQEQQTLLLNPLKLQISFPASR